MGETLLTLWFSTPKVRPDTVFSHLQIVKATLDDGRIVDNYHVTLTLLNIGELSRDDIDMLNISAFPVLGKNCALQSWRESGNIRPLQRKNA